MSFSAFLDTCSIYGSTLNDVLLRLAAGGAFRPLWSEGVLEELEANLLRRGIPAEKVAHRIATMRDHFPDAMVDGYGSLVDQMTCDPKDRHVLAAAVRAKAEVLVTFNVIDFPPASVEPFDIDVVDPDEFLLDQLDLYPGLTIDVLEHLVRTYAAPPMTMDDLLGRLSDSGVPRFSREVYRHR